MSFTEAILLGATRLARRLVTQQESWCPHRDWISRQLIRLSCSEELVRRVIFVGRRAFSSILRRDRTRLMVFEIDHLQDPIGVRARLRHFLGDLFWGGFAIFRREAARHVRNVEIVGIVRESKRERHRRPLPACRPPEPVDDGWHFSDAAHHGADLWLHSLTRAEVLKHR